MSFSDRIKKAWNILWKYDEAPHVTEQPQKPEASEKKPLAPSYTQGWKGEPRRVYSGGDFIDVMELRRLSLTPTPFMCEQKLVNDVVSTAWEIAPLAKEGQEEPDDTAKDHAKTVSTWLLAAINSNSEGFSTHILPKVCSDLLTLDAGVMLKWYGKRGNHNLTQLWASDGGLYWKEVDVFQRIGKVHEKLDVPIDLNIKHYKNYKVGYWYNPMGEPQIPWENHEVIYMMMNPRTDIPYGTSKIQVLKTVIAGLMHGEEYIYEFWKNGGVGSCVIGTEEGLTDAVWTTWKDRILAELKKSIVKVIPLDHKPFVNQLGPSPKDMQWLETREEYRHMVMALFNMTPAAFGYTKDIQKATDLSQRSLYIKRGLYPILRAIEWHLNTQMITEWFWTEPKDRQIFSHEHKGKWTGKKIDICFRFKLYDPVGDKLQADVDEQLMKLGIKTVNDLRKRDGLPPVPWGDINPQFLLTPQQWAQAFWGYNVVMEEDWTKFTGLGAPTQIFSAVTPQTTTEQDSKAYKKSRTT